ncbi:3-deoxy-manno-octulosonate cytidylyltransferase [Thioalkalivibrio sulfidiphilus]|uniref:3-deoxy-manno-octulosonate cytidylyltransferase n=1 Tax=Thioalkalivibrio sulfidiphilus (strain HL-EbGR7) TaxID=396588 RepID=KDSB_THISH|nr:3-deoxy-manno-octulosonate cytidylyltransferase [Thioalkalivibrio sulfidiphilus]B8GR40.1 RecName: Full=3-deoxy-manno-octulosonate cytidylyltransferase; AltName: Full=CMP-2-keto-3-deoxyoctulosonic acid synthase; Short=CKS; Short=CMP-KDO synthase [Thioalkalivibrio sulfidiphilus HL-EbGr7]ACL72460.1 3-deoxy-D-manno-octulosonate cytidylyltransferase [Thioalkalivibrio sulfidiphilus HL-EbGr7]
MSFKVAIPARYASTRLPGKPLLMLGGKPMIQHVHERALACGAEEVVIATDDTRISDVAEGFGARVVLTDAHHESGSDRIAEVATELGWRDDDIVVNLQGDEPLTPPDILHQVAEALERHTDAAMATLCTPIETVEQMLDPNVVKVVRDAADYALYFSRAPIPWDRNVGRDVTHRSLEGCHRHIGLYAYRVGFLKAFAAMSPCALELTERLEQLRALHAGARIQCPVASQVPGQGVDVSSDVERVEKLLRA